MLNDKVDLEIYGRKYTVEFEGITPIELTALAEELTRRMQAVAAESEIVDTSRLAVLVALGCLVEITGLKNRQADQRTAEERSLEGLVLSLQNALDAFKEPARKQP